MSVNNVIHKIRFTPRKYAVPDVLLKKFLVTEDVKYIITENGKKIRL